MTRTLLNLLLSAFPFPSNSGCLVTFLNFSFLLLFSTCTTFSTNSLCSPLSFTLVLHSSHNPSKSLFPQCSHGSLGLPHLLSPPRSVDPPTVPLPLSRDDRRRSVDTSPRLLLHQCVEALIGTCLKNIDLFHKLLYGQNCYSNNSICFVTATVEIREQEANLDDAKKRYLYTCSLQLAVFRFSMC